jgi:Enolase C-terminal domain-like
VQADVVRVGGTTPYLEIAALARAFGVPLPPNFMMELSGQLLCCPPNAHILEKIDGGSLTDLGALAEPIRIEDGWFTPPAPLPRHRLRPRRPRRPRGRRHCCEPLVFVRPNEADLAAACVPEFLNRPGDGCCEQARPVTRSDPCGRVESELVVEIQRKVLKRADFRYARRGSD